VSRAKFGVLNPKILKKLAPVTFLVSVHHLRGRSGLVGPVSV